MLKSIKFKIYMVLVVFLLLMVGSSFVSIRNFKRLDKSIDLIMNNNFDSIVIAQQMREVIERQDSLELTFLFEDDKKSLSPDYDKSNIKFLELIYEARQHISENNEKDMIDDIEKNYTIYSSKVRELEKLKNEKNSDAAKVFYYNDILPIFEDIKDDTYEILDMNQKSMVVKKEESTSLANNATYYTLFILGAALITGIIIIGALLKKIIKPIEDLTVGIKEVSLGNYDYKIPLRRDKEINSILESFNNMGDRLKEYEVLNINELLNEKQKAEAIIESIESPIIVTDDKSIIIMINKAAERIFDVKEKSIVNRLELKDISELNELKETTNNELEVLDGKNKIYYRVISNGIISKENKKIGTVLLLQNITKFKDVERLKTEFVSTVSHEFRTPLTSISMAVDLLLQNSFSSKEEMDEMLNIIKDDGERLNILVQELLDLTKMESGKIEMDIKDIDIRDLILSIKNTFKIQFDEKNINFIFDTVGIHRYVKADFNKISWVMVNLVGNAIRYVKRDGTGEIKLKVNEVNNEMLISISDNGEGISEESQKIIFEKFVQIKNSEGETTGSSGLGLAICKEIVKAHRGEIWVDSNVGVGSTFYFTLKLGPFIED
ncbi:HAMP domain-containing sensor histidine kinase [Clostridium chrysemydis]|uniref:HAMP domain-containing sensor histidine kinase n=1 Tax=Clostridium chrysemydis TaxID=2665504 RepID=UPI001883A28A|nr:ATP-binding protein [Clostridium chrysemydis]